MRLKVLVVGEAKCGKSSMVHAYLKENAESGDGTQWNPLFGKKQLEFDSSQYSLTLGVDYYAAPIPTSRAIPASGSFAGGMARVYTSFIDLSGDLAYVKVRSEFYSDWNAIFFCFDSTNRESFKQLESWLAEADKFGATQSAQARSTSSIRVVVACKCDESLPNFERTVSTSEARSWAESRDMMYIETSARLAMSRHVPLTRKQSIATILDRVLEKASGEVKLPQGMHSSSHTGGNSDSSSNSASYEQKRGSYSSQSSANSKNSFEQSSSSSSSSLAPPESMTLQALMAELAERGIPRAAWGLERSDMVDTLTNARKEQSQSAARRSSFSNAGSGGSSTTSSSSTHVSRPNPQPSPHASTAASSSSSPSTGESQIESESGLNEATTQRIKSELEAWAKNKDIRSMLNSLHSVTPKDSLFLAADADLTLVSKIYKRALLKVHPDKQDPSDRMGMYRANEMFKIVNNAFEVFKSSEERKEAAISAAAASSTKAFTRSKATHTPHYGQPTGQRKRR